METEYWISELGRLYQRSSEAIENDETNAIGPLASQFNEVLDNLQTEFEDNEIVSGTDPVQGSTENATRSSGKTTVISPSRARPQALHEIRSRCERMANAIGYDLPEIDQGSSYTDNMVMVSVESSQEATQEVNQEVSIESVHQMVDSLPRSQGEKDDLRELIDDFEQELEEGRDEDHLRNILDEVKDISRDAAAQLAAVGLAQGAQSLLPI